MSATNTQPNSEQELMRNIWTLSDAGGSLIQIRTRESVRTAMALRKSILASEESTYREWDVVNGWRDTFTTANFTDNIGVTGDNSQVFDAVDFPLKQLRDVNSAVNQQKDKIHYFAFLNIHPFFPGNAMMIELMQQYATILPQTNVCVLLITPDAALDDLPTGTVLTVEMKTPNAEELAKVLSDMLEHSSKDFANGVALDEDDIMQVAYLGLGMTLQEFETHAAISAIEASLDQSDTLTVGHLIEGIGKGKTEVVKQSEILELYPSTNIDEVGGMDRLKDWVKERAGCYSDEAKAFGVEPPKGMVLVGVPGAGKSLTAKAVSSVFGVPLVRMDMGRVFSKFVGDSESRMRSALSMVVAMAPCVLFVDEIDKGLGGIGGGGSDSGTSSRVLGSFLTWLQDCKAPVFTMVTANRVEGLPPELLRRGRFDAIFSVGMPNVKERQEVLRIHLDKRGLEELEFSKTEMSEFITASNRYVPAEIESAVKDGLVTAFSRKEELSMAHIIEALENMVPMSKSYAVQIASIEEWAMNNATPVNYQHDSSTQLAKQETTNTIRRIGAAARRSTPNRSK